MAPSHAAPPRHHRSSSRHRRGSEPRQPRRALLLLILLTGATIGVVGWSAVGTGPKEPARPESVVLAQAAETDARARPTPATGADRATHLLSRQRRPRTRSWTTSDSQAGWTVFDADDRPSGLSGRQARSRSAGPVDVLHAWDRARAAAYADGSVAALRKLYAGRAGAGDVRLLRSYLRRGYRIEGLRMQLLAVEVLAHEPARWRLRVTDRLAAGVAVGYGERVALPRDRASTRTVVLRRDRDGGWRVVRVRG